MYPALTRGNGVRDPGGARGRDGNWQTSRAQTSRHAGSDPAARTIPHSFNWQDPGFWSRESWFESTVGSSALVARSARAVASEAPGTRSIRARGSPVLVAQRQRHQPESLARAGPNPAADT